MIHSLPQSSWFLGAKIDTWDMRQTVAEIERRLDSGVLTQHCVVNAAKIVNMRKDAHLRSAVNSCDIVNIDGMGVVWGGRILGHDIVERVAGVDLFFRLLDLAAKQGRGVYFLGARQDVLDQAVANCRGAYPALKICGWHHGYFGDDEEPVVRQISQSGAELLFVAMSSPKKEQFIHRWRDRLGVKFAMGVGGTFDIAAGKSKRAPLWMQTRGLEWLYRVKEEPRRMWKRYLFTNAVFLGLVARAWLRPGVPSEKSKSSIVSGRG